MCKELQVGLPSCPKYTGAFLFSTHVINDKLLQEMENKVILISVLLEPCSLDQNTQDKPGPSLYLLFIAAFVFSLYIFLF